MCESRQKAIYALALNISASMIQMKQIRKVYGTLRVKDAEVLDKLDAAMMEAAQYLVDELEAKE